MATIYSGYTAPSEILWCGGDVTASSQSLSTGATASVREGGSSYRVCWKCPHYTYQLQYRMRRRYSPAYAATLGYPSDAEEWEGWGDWQGCDLSSDVKSATERLTWGDLSITSATFDFGYDFSQYDRIEYQVRVRAFDEPTLRCSEWGYGDLSAIYEPNASVASAVRQPNGDVLLSVETNWMRGGNRFALTNLRRDSARAKAVSGTVRLVNVEPDFEATVPAAMAGDAQRAYARMTFYTSDNSKFGGFSQQWFDIGEDEPPSSIAEPSVTVSDDGCRAVVSVESTGDPYEAVYVTATFTDALGNQTVEEAEVSESDGTWTALVCAPPYDVPVTYRAAVVNADGWDGAEVVHTTPSAGRCTWSDGDDEASLVFDLEVKSTFTAATEVTDAADGTSIPRFGFGGSRSLSVEGVLLAPSVADGAWRPALELLRQPRTWTYRKPGGERYRVVVTSVSDSESKGAIDRVVSASVSMREVG